jgi:hypothetical protein
MADLFEQSEGTRADLKNDLGIALLKCNANIYLAQLMIWVFNTTDRTKPLKKSYEELASRPWGLCCSRSQAYATVKKAERLGILHATPTYTGPGIQGSNEYSIDWDGVRRIVGVRRAVTYTTTCDPPLTTCDPPLTTCDPPLTTCDPPLTTCDASKEYTSSHLSTPSFTPSRRDDAECRDGARDVFTDEELAAVRSKANTIDKWIAAKEPADRQLILKIATLWHDGELPDDCVEQVLESFQRKREAHQKISRPCGWLWTALRDQLRKHDVRLEPLLARTRWPEQLITSRGGARVNADGKLELIYTAPRTPT